MSSLLTACCVPAFQVDAVEGEWALIVELESGRPTTVPLSELPRDAGEGAIVENGRVESARTEELRARVRQARRKLALERPIDGSSSR